MDGCLRHVRYLIYDRDPLFCRGFRELLAGGGVTCVRLPERFVGSIRRECLGRVIPLGSSTCVGWCPSTSLTTTPTVPTKGSATDSSSPRSPPKRSGVDPVPRTAWWLAALLSPGGCLNASVEFW